MSSLLPLYIDPSSHTDDAVGLTHPIDRDRSDRTDTPHASLHHDRLWLTGKNVVYLSVEIVGSGI